jgi:hypothetical protein
MNILSRIADLLRGGKLVKYWDWNPEQFAGQPAE